LLKNRIFGKKKEVSEGSLREKIKKTENTFIREEEGKIHTRARSPETLQLGLWGEFQVKRGGKKFRPKTSKPHSRQDHTKNLKMPEKERQ